jgi:hypothetical protein
LIKTNQKIPEKWIRLYIENVELKTNYNPASELNQTETSVVLDIS